MTYRLPFNARYGFAVGRIRVLEKRFLTRQLMDRLLTAARPEDAGRILTEAGYHGTADVRSWREVEALIQAEYQSALGLIDQLSKDSVWTDVLKKRIDLHNLRVLLREVLIGEPQDALLTKGGSVAAETMRSAVQAETEEPLPLFLQKIVNRFHEWSDEERDWQEIDSTIDHAEFTLWQDALKKAPNAFLESWRALESDLFNLRSCFRLKVLDGSQVLLEKILVSGGHLPPSLLISLFAEPWNQVVRVLGRTEYAELITQAVRNIESGRPFFNWEQMCQEIRLQGLQMARNCGFGIEVLFAYLLLKDIELDGVRRVVIGLANDLQKEEIEKGLPEHVFV